MSVAVSADLPAGVTKVATVEGITEYRLANGLKVLLIPDSSKPTVTVNLTIFVGSRHEGYGETGMAHLLEHMVFKGTPDHQNIPKLLQDRGAQFNGTTSDDRTNYFETLPASDENLEFALTLEADRMVNSSIKPEDLASEFTVVRNEFERGENSPGAILSQRMMAAAYEWHNYGKRTIGNRSDIERVPVDRLRAFYEKYYQADNAMLIVAGRFEEAKALELILKTFGRLPKPDRKLDATYTEEPPQDGERTVTLRRVGETGMVGVAYHIPASSDPEFASLQVLNSILTADGTGRLYKELVEGKIAASVGGFCRSTFDPGMLLVMAEVKKGDSIEAARDALIEKTESTARTAISEEEVNRARQRLLKQWEQQLTNTDRLAVGLSNWASQGDWRLLFIYRDRLEGVTAESVQAAAEKYLQRSNRTVGVYIPTDKPERTPIPSRKDISELVNNYKGREGVSAGEAFDVSPGNIERRTTRLEIGGLKVCLLPKKTRDQAVRMSVNLRYGDVESLRGKALAAESLPPLMLRGTRQLTRQQFLDELDRQKSQIGAGGGAGSLSFSVQTRTPNLTAVLDLLRQVIREPALPAEEFEVLKRQALADLDSQLTEPSQLGPNALQRHLFEYAPDDVRYTPTIAEQVSRMQALTLDDVRGLYESFVGSQAGEIAVVGEFEPNEVLPILKSMFDGWNSPRKYARIPEPARNGVEPLYSAIRTPDKANATYSAGLTLPIKTSHPDYPALVIGNFVLGSSGLSSRLGDRIRQREGLSYGVRSSFSVSHLDERAELGMTAICNPENIKKVEKAALEELTKLVESGLTEKELAGSKAAYIQAARVRWTDDATLAALLNSTSYNGLTFRYYGELEEKINNLTLESVSAALKKHVDPKKVSVVSAGDFKDETAK